MKKAIKFFAAVILLNCLQLCELKAQDQIIQEGDTIWTTSWDEGFARQAEFTADGRHIVVCAPGNYGVLYLIDAQNGDIIWKWKKNDMKFYNFQISRDETQIITLTMDEQIINIIDLESGELVQEYYFDKPEEIPYLDQVFLTIDPDILLLEGGTYIATYSISQGEITKWNKVNNKWLVKSQISNNGQYLATARLINNLTEYETNQLELWDALTLEKIKVLGTLDGDIIDVHGDIKFTDDDRYLAFALSGVKIFDLSDFSLYEEYNNLEVEGENIYIPTLSFSFTNQFDGFILSEGSEYNILYHRIIDNKSLFFLKKLAGFLVSDFRLNTLIGGSSQILTLFNFDPTKVSVESINNHSDNILYPNPTNGEISITIDPNSQIKSISLFNEVGEKK